MLCATQVTTPSPVWIVITPAASLSTISHASRRLVELRRNKSVSHNFACEASVRASFFFQGEFKSTFSLYITKKSLHSKLNINFK